MSFSSGCRHMLRVVFSLKVRIAKLIIYIWGTDGIILNVLSFNSMGLSSGVGPL
jgi:hypothetical protein